MASVLPLFPRASHQRPPKRGGPTRVFGQATSWHVWQRSLWGFRCTKCLVFFGRRQHERPELGCEGFPERVAELLVSAPDHGRKLASTQVGDEANPLFFCLACGAHSQRKIRSLATRCQPGSIRSGGQ
eukprot:2894223-Pyramimonas_sp.AAC.1